MARTTLKKTPKRRPQRHKARAPLEPTAPVKAEYLVAGAYSVVPQIKIKKDYGYSLFKVVLLCLPIFIGTTLLWLVHRVVYPDVLPYRAAITPALLFSGVFIAIGLVFSWFDPLEEKTVEWKIYRREDDQQRELKR